MIKSKILCLFSVVLLSATTVLAASFEEGKEAHTTGDYEKALTILRPMAEKGHARAQILVGKMYESGDGVIADPQAAIDWYEKSASQGNSVLQHELGRRYFQGADIPQNYGKAAAWWRMAADSGIAESQHNLGVMYAEGKGFEKDHAQAMRWYSKAAAQGYAPSQYSLGVMYAFGQGVTQDYFKGIAYFRDAAEKGVVQAQYNLAVLLENGRGTDVDLDGARKWYLKASEGGVDQATVRLTVLEGQVLSKQSHPLPDNENEELSKTESITTTVQLDTLTIPETEITEIKPADLTEYEVVPPENHEVISGEMIARAMEQQTPSPEAEKTERAEVTMPAEIDQREEKSKESIKPITKEVEPIDRSVRLEDESWIRAQNPEHYSLQMIAFSKKDNAKRYMENLRLEGEKAVYQSIMHGKIIYKVIYGNFENHRASLKARRSLPTKYRETKPFPRSFEFIQKDIKE